MPERFMVTGGAGYIGSHMVRMLLDGGANVTVVDDLSQGHRAALPPEVELVVADVADRSRMDEIMAGRTWHAIIHFAALSLVGESMALPMRYLRENAAGGFSLVESALRNKVPRFILSSTASVFGEPEAVPITEDAPLAPTNPYGEGKRMVEAALHWASERHGLRTASLRYFNAAGADPGGRLGEDHNPETHLIPLVIDAALGRRGALTVFGTDYDTPDGSCIRDYVHVNDLCDAHLCALRALDRGSVTYNLGNGQGHSVKEVIASVERVSGRRVPVEVGYRRPGDPARLVASAARIRAETGWTPRYAALDDMVRTALTWRIAHPDGYGDRASAP